MNIICLNTELNESFCTKESCQSLHGKSLPMYFDLISDIIKVAIHKKYCGVNGCNVNDCDVNDDMNPLMDELPTEIIKKIDNLNVAIDKFLKNHSMVDCKTHTKTLNLLNLKKQPYIIHNREAFSELEKNNNIVVHDIQCHDGGLPDNEFSELISTLSECILYTPALKITNFIMVLKAGESNHFVQIEINRKTDPIVFGYYSCKFDFC